MNTPAPSKFAERPVRWISIADLEETRSWSGLSRDVLYAWRAIAQRSTLSIVVVITLAMALAAKRTTFNPSCSR